MKFPSMDWEKDSDLPLNMVCKNLWLSKYKWSYSFICDFFWAPSFKFFHGKECPRLLEEAKVVIKSIGYQFLFEEYTYLRIYGVTDPPHILPKYVLDRLILSEIAFQTMIVGFNNFYLKRRKINYLFPIIFQLDITA